MIKKLQILILLVFVNLIGFSQLDGADREEKWDEDNIYLDGIVSDYYTGRSISGVRITATGGGKTISGTSDEKGEYKLVLEYDEIYTITFSKAGLTSKKITMNTNGVPDLKRQKVPDMGAEITMFKPNKCIKSEMLDAPIGRAIYYPKKNIMDWDMDYSMDKLIALNEMLTQFNIALAKTLPVPPISKIEYDLKDELIRQTIMDTQDDVEEIKETLKKIDERLYEMTR